MKNFISVGDTLTVTTPVAVASGEGVRLNSMFGIAANDAAGGGQVAINLTGVYDLPKVNRSGFA